MSLLAVQRGFVDVFVVPQVLRSSLKFHPLAAILAILAGAELLGFFGVFLGARVAAVLWMLFNKTNPEGFPPRTHPVAQALRRRRRAPPK